MLAEVLISIALKSSLLLAVGLLAASTLALSATARHLILLASLLASLFLPVLSLCLPGLPVPFLSTLQHEPSFVGEIEGAVQGDGAWVGGLTTLVALFWAAGAALLMNRTIGCWRALADVVRRARPVQNTAWLALLGECCAGMSMVPPRLLCSDEAEVAFATGWLRPTIVIPGAAHDWSESRLRDVLLHELAHIERRDSITHFLAQLARDLYFWNPLAILAERRSREQREYACDDRVLSCGQMPETYAATLVDVAESLVTPVSIVAPTMASDSSLLEGRVRAVLDTQRRRDQMSAVKVAVVVIPTAVLLLPLAAIRTGERDLAPRQPSEAPARFERPQLQPMPPEMAATPWAVMGTVPIAGPGGGMTSGVAFGSGSSGTAGAGAVQRVIVDFAGNPAGQLHLPPPGFEPPPLDAESARVLLEALRRAPSRPEGEVPRESALPQ